MYILRVKNNYAERNSNLGHKILKTNVCLVNMYFVTGPCRNIFLSNSFIAGLFGSCKTRSWLTWTYDPYTGGPQALQLQLCAPYPRWFSLSCFTVSSVSILFTHTHCIPTTYSSQLSSFSPCPWPFSSFLGPFPYSWLLVCLFFFFFCDPFSFNRAFSVSIAFKLCFGASWGYHWVHN